MSIQRPNAKPLRCGPYSTGWGESALALDAAAIRRRAATADGSARLEWRLLWLRCAGIWGAMSGDGCDVRRKVCGGPGFRDYQPYGRRFCAGVFSPVFSMPEAWGAVADAVAAATTPVNEIGDSLNEPVATWMLMGGRDYLKPGRGIAFSPDAAMIARAFWRTQGAFYRK